LGDNCVIVKRPRLVCDDKQSGATLVGLATAMSHACRSCGCNAHNALCYRHGTRQPPVVRDFVFSRDFFLQLRPLVADSYYDYFSHWEDAWIEKWPLGKRRAIENSETFEFVCPDEITCMVKREGGHTFPKKARCIQYYRTMCTQSLFGPHFTALQKACVEVLYRRGQKIKVTLASGLNSVQLGRWMSDCLDEYDTPFFYERDGKSWDATMQRAHHDLKLVLYDVVGDDFVRFVEQGFSVRACGRFDTGELKYRLRGTVKSGHNDTTLGNSLVNAAIAFEAMSVLGLSGDIIVAGDDLLVVLASDFDEHAFARVESELGITPEYRKFNDYRDVSFISGIWCDAGGLLFVPKPGRLLSRLMWTTKPPIPRDFDAYVHSVVVGQRDLSGFLPVMNAFYRANDRDARLIATGKRPLVDPGLPDVDPMRVFAWFCDRYSIVPAEIADCESFVLGHAGKVGLLVHPVLDQIMSVDLSDLGDRPVVGTDYRSVGVHGPSCQ